MDVISRDQDFITASKNFPIWVMIILDKDKMYMGHVYLWLQPNETEYAFMLGIRTTPLMLFLRNVGKGLSNISNIMLEGFKQFAIAHQRTKLVVPHPIKTMRDILNKSGFMVNSKNVTGQDIGKIGKLLNQLVDANNICDDCFIKNI